MSEWSILEKPANALYKVWMEQLLSMCIAANVMEGLTVTRSLLDFSLAIHLFYFL